MDKLVIDKENYSHLVWREQDGYFLNLLISLPKMTRKGYLGHKISKKMSVPSIRIQNQEGAYKLFAEWKEEFVPRFLAKEFMVLRISCSPIYFYKILCPNCKGEAHILDFLSCSWIQSEGENLWGHPISCSNCWDGPKSEWFMNEVGYCEYIEKDNEEKDLLVSLQYHNSSVKYEEFIKDPSILDSRIEKGNW